MAFNLAGVLSIVVFYILILIVGIWAGRKKKTHGEGDEFEQEEVMLAGRNIGLFVGIFTMTGRLHSWPQLTELFMYRCMQLPGSVVATSTALPR